MVLAVEADNGGKIGDVRAGQGAGDHTLLDPVDIPHVIFDAGECQGGDADPAVLKHNMCLLLSLHKIVLEIKLARFNKSKDPCQRL